MPTIPLDNKKIINAWAMFDWANSSYALVISVAIFPIYFNAVVPKDYVFLGIPVTNTSLYSYTISFAYLIFALILPLLSGIADYSGKKVQFMKVFTWLGGLACISMFFFQSHTIELGVFAFFFATMGFAGGQVFNNAYLPLITTAERYDSVSARGFALGYVGSVLLLIANIVILQNADALGLPDDSWGPRIAFVMVGLWWIGWAQITFSRLPKEPQQNMAGNIIYRGYQEVMKVWQEARQFKNLKRFLLSFFFYSAGVQTVLFLASTFATDELKFETGDLIFLIILLQGLAFVGALLFGWLSGKIGNRTSLMIMLVIWMVNCIAAYFTYSHAAFYVIAMSIGLVMGGIQSLSRSTYSKIIPQDTEDTASYFSFFDVLEKIAIVLGTFSFGFIDQMMGGMRNSIFALVGYFVVGILLLFLVKVVPPKKA